MADSLPAKPLDLQELAHEIATQFFPDPVLCFRHGLTPTRLEELKREPELRRLILDEQLAIAQNGEAFRLAAAAEATKVMKEFAKLAVDEGVPYAQRLKAGELVAQWAGGGYGGNAVAIAGLGMTINLQTNLALGPMTPTGGEYELEAIEVKGEDDLIG